MGKAEAHNALRTMSPEAFQIVMGQLLSVQQTQRQENQLHYYQPVSDEALKVHTSSCKTLGVFGGNGSSKTETCLVEMMICATGILPLALKDFVDPKLKFRGPINCRVVCESLTTVLYPIILPKLQWWKWSGVSSEGGEQGHWGWAPRSHLIAGKWDRSWSDKLRILKLLYHDPENPGRVIGESSIQFMSVDQDPSDFASGDYHIVLHDEPPNQAIWRENEARTMRVAGRKLLAMTWPDDPAIAVDWIFDEVYEPGQPGSHKHPDIDCINLFTTDNPHMNQEAIAEQATKWSKETADVRIYGKHLRFSNRIHPLFTSTAQYWCFTCLRAVLDIDGLCTTCGNGTTEFTHVEEFETPRYPAIWALDPHPRKPHMFAWFCITPEDDIWVVADGEVEGDPVDVRKESLRIEQELGLHVAQRIIDPNMGRSPSSSQRGIVWQDEFDQAGLITDLADDSDVGRARLNEFMRPCNHTRRPRFKVHPRATRLIHQLLRYRWDDHRLRLEKDIKQKPKAKEDDYPTLCKYVMNLDPSFGQLRMGPQIVRRRRA